MHPRPAGASGTLGEGGLTPSEAIAYARAAAEKERLGVDLRRGDVRALPAGVRADVAMCMGNAFGYLEHAGTQEFLAGLAGLVVPGGSPALDCGFVAESLLPGLALEEPPMTPGGVEAVSVDEYDAANGRWLTSFTFRRGAQEHRGTSAQHAYTAAEVVRLGSPRLLLVARRP
ncbi:hypothetical protein HS041_25440 [Planomonospora sp. ID67723]|uniref:hypothetical protein n=1 Tax=Planomonospora sp. ID67723 TaxID=2738134 RepID=UPI0018C364EB|nr:hypothetical protein [Planomonospora sp. ID67723]MBG0831108.1 hypothetical protein [Planomonospora sp. ID67723]